MSAKVRLALMVVLALAQLAVPGTIIAIHESVLRLGKPYKFRVAPVDPYDAFRGRYVALGFARTQAPAAPGMENQRGPAWARVVEEPDGFAGFAEVAPKPAAEGDWIKVMISYAYRGTANFRLPFDRFYMEESAAPEAERALWRRSWRQRTSQEAYVVVRIRGGRAVVEQLFLAGVPIAEYLKQNPPEKEQPR